MKAVGSGTFVFAFMALLTFHTATGFFYRVLGDVKPWALIKLDSFIRATLIAPFGMEIAVGILVFLTVLFSWLAFQRASD